MARITWSPFSGRVPSKLLVEMSKVVTALIIPMPLAGSVPLMLLWKVRNSLTACITWSPLSGSAPSKLFVEIVKPVTARIVRMPLSGIVPSK
eukprot:2511120-Amphidinium_carterae.1